MPRRMNNLVIFFAFTSLSALFILQDLKSTGTTGRIWRSRSMETEPFPDPGTPAARSHGCICPESQFLPSSLFSPRVLDFSSPWVVDTDCPLHGEIAHEEHKKGPRH